MNILIGFLTAIHVLVAIFLIVLVLMQKSKDQGVGAAFGGGVTETVFGAGTTTALVRMTIWCAGVLLATSLILAVLHSRYRGEGGGGSLMQKMMQEAPAAPAPGPAASQPMVPLPANPAPAPAAPATPAAPAAPAGKTP